MKTTLNLFAALALAAGMAAPAQAQTRQDVPQGTVKYACVKNDGWLLMRAHVKVKGKTSRKSRPTATKRTVCFRLPKDTTFRDRIVFYASVDWNTRQKTMNLPYRPRHTHVSVSLTHNWIGRHVRLHNSWQHSKCGRCDYYDF